MANMDSLILALTAFAELRSPGAIARALKSDGRPGLEDKWRELDSESARLVESKAASLAERGIDAVLFGDDNFPVSLVPHGKPVAPILFYWGDPQLFRRDGVGMCGSRAVTELGLQAARACGEEVSNRGLIVISGYARGVDTETHLAALQSGGSTVIVLAEGFDHFRVKRAFARDFDPARVLVVSQFPPTQPWGAYAAMARNSVIFGLGRALVVIEAGDRGGTLAAGKGALKMGRPVIALDFGDATPPGNRTLLEAGARKVQSRAELGDVLDGMPRREQGPTVLPREQVLF
jgi:DNA processing protein